MRGMISLLRPKQWIKNIFVLAPLIFTGQFTQTDSIIAVLYATLFFCLASSSVYIVNDYHDIEADRKHPRKSKKRPLASGAVSKPQALVMLGIILAMLATGFMFQYEVMMVILAYLAVNLAYTFVLKHQPVIDIFAIAIGFVLRVYAGATALSVPVSSWMFVTTLCLALYLAAVKRRQELALSGSEGRKVLEHYSIALVDRYAEMSATGALLFYSLFVMTTRPELVMTIPFVLYGLFRYWFVAESSDAGESPTDVLFKDWQLQVTILCWTGVCIWALSG